MRASASSGSVPYRSTPPSSAGQPRAAGCRRPAASTARPGCAARRGTVALLLLQGCAGHARQVAAVEAAVELPLAVRPPRVGPGVAEAQDLVLAQLPHPVQTQGPHLLHEGLRTVPTGDGNPAHPENGESPGPRRRVPPTAGPGPPRRSSLGPWPPRTPAGGMTWRPGTAGRRGDRHRPPRHPRWPAGRPPIPGTRRGPCRSQTSPGPRSCDLSWTRNWH